MADVRRRVPAAHDLEAEPPRRGRFATGWRALRSHRAPLAIGVLLGFGLWFGIRVKDGPSDTFEIPASIPGPGRTAFASALFQTLGVHLQAGHRVALVEDGAIFDVLVREFAKARSSIHVLMYIWEAGAASDQVTAAIAERTSKGVACRILVDAVGSAGFRDEVADPLVGAGCDVRVFRPIEGGDRLTRNHRKIIVVDGRVAITGGFGIRDNWKGDGESPQQWRETNVVFSGPTVADAQQAFAENWQEAGGGFLPPEAFPKPDRSGPSSAVLVSSTASPVVTRAERLSQLMIAAATKRIWISNAYFVPPRAILDLLQEKASMGVDVRVLAPGFKSDSKTAFGAQHLKYDELLERGVRVWEYEPTMMHAKTMVVDDDLAVVGSINLDPLSLNTLEEAALVIVDPTIAKELARSFEKDCALATEL
jgi:cardiolipin synthase A/B